MSRTEKEKPENDVARDAPPVVAATVLRNASQKARTASPTSRWSSFSIDGSSRPSTSDRNSSGSSRALGIQHSVNLLRRAGLNSRFPKSSPGFIVAKRRNSGWATISQSSDPPRSESVNVRSGSKTELRRSMTASAARLISSMRMASPFCMACTSGPSDHSNGDAKSWQPFWNISNWVRTSFPDESWGLPFSVSIASGPAPSTNCGSSFLAIFTACLKFFASSSATLWLSAAAILAILANSSTSAALAFPQNSGNAVRTPAAATAICLPLPR